MPYSSNALLSFVMPGLDPGIHRGAGACVSCGSSGQARGWQGV